MMSTKAMVDTMVAARRCRCGGRDWRVGTDRLVGRGHDGGPMLLARMADGDGLRPADLGARPGVIEIDLPCGARVRVDAAVDRAGAGPGAGRAEATAVIQVAPGTKVYLACRPVSMRYGFDGLGAKVASVLAPLTLSRLSGL